MSAILDWHRARVSKTELARSLGVSAGTIDRYVSMYEHRKLPRQLHLRHLYRRRALRIPERQEAQQATNVEIGLAGGGS